VYNDKKEIYRFVFWDHDTWRFQRTDLYDSPTIRDVYGLGWSEKWKYKGHYWEATAIPFEFDRDRPENTELQPFFRLEYGRTFSPNHKFVAGAEYGARTDRTNGSNSLNHFGESQYDVKYEINW
jgi:hypothetical protein